MNLSDTDWALVRKAVQKVIDTTLSQSEHDALKGVLMKIDVNATTGTCVASDTNWSDADRKAMRAWADTHKLCGND